MVATGRRGFRSIPAPFRRFRVLVSVHFGAVSLWCPREVWVSVHFCTVSAFPGALVAMARCSFRSIFGTVSLWWPRGGAGCGPFLRHFGAFRALWWPWLGARFGPFRRRFALMATGRCRFRPAFPGALVAMARCSFRSICSAPFRYDAHGEVRVSVHFCAVSALPGALVAMARCSFRSLSALLCSGGHGEVRVSVHICTVSAIPGGHG